MLRLPEFGLILLLLSPPAALAQDITARYYPEKQEYLVGEPIVIVLELANNSSADIDIEDGHCYWEARDEFQVDNAPAKCAASPPGGSCVMNYKRIAAGTKLRRRVLLAGPFDLGKPGTYHVEALGHVTLYQPGRRDEVISDIDAKSEFEIVLREPNEGDLEAAYKPFLADVGSADEEKSLFAVLALTQNPPRFLEDVIGNIVDARHDEFMGIDGLKRLGTSAARAKLIELASSADEWEAPRAMCALGELGNPDDCDAVLAIAAKGGASIQAEAFSAAGHICRERAVSLLAGLLPSVHQELARAIVSGLGDTSSRNAVPILIELLASPDFVIRDDASEALMVLTHRATALELFDPKQARQVHDDWREWWAANSEKAAIYGPDECMQSNQRP